MRTTIFYKKNQELNLTKAWFRAMPTCRKGLLIDTIFFNEPEFKKDWTYNYEELMSLNTEFYVRKPKTGWLTYKTFKGLMSKLYEETRTLKNQ